MNYVQAIVIVIVPLVILLLPALFLIRLRQLSNVLGNGARIILWNITAASLGSLLLAAMHLPVWWYAVIAGGVAVIALVWRRREVLTQKFAWQSLAIITPLIIVYGAFTVPFLFLHDGLPTGDIQKTIFWSGRILERQALPDYNISQELFNRDPVDFYTPALHTFSALTMALSPEPLTTISLMAIMLAVTVAWLAAAITREIFDKHPHVAPPLLAAVFVLTNIRFLRYLREPGYHYQNIMGEVLLFGLLWLGLHIINKKSVNWRSLQKTVLLVFLCVVTLALSHQFSTFIAAKAAMAFGAGVLAVRRTRLAVIILEHRRTALAAVGLFVVAVVGGFLLGLHTKLPHIFTASPHLLSLAPPLSDYPPVLGALFFTGGLAGLALMAWQARLFRTRVEPTLVFLLVTGVLFALSQGPRLFIDIPPVRAMFYLVVPLSVSASFFFGKVIQHVRLQHAGLSRTALGAAIIIVALVPSGASLAKAFQTVSHTVRTNSTLTAQQQNLIEYIMRNADSGDGILIDDYNRRSTSWFLLAGRPVFARIAADLERQMDEAGQSEKRYELYVQQLDYEKVYALGSKPALAHVLRKHGIRYVAGATNSSTSAFEHNPALRPVTEADGITLFERIDDVACAEHSRCAWLLRTSTLVNDIGDREDTFEHLQASLRTPRLSPPQFDGVNTFRFSTASVIPITFNIGDYVRVLWDKENTGIPDTPLEFYVQFTARPKQLAISAGDGSRYDIPFQEEEAVRIPASAAQFSEKGFVTVYIENPNEELVGIDLIALGLARTL